MAESRVDDELRRSEGERDDLQRSIAQVEAALAASTPGTRGLLQRFIEGAKGRINTLEGKIKEIVAERETHERTEVMVTRMAQEEAALSAEEKSTFGGFLRKSYFTKSDFANLEKFYANSWDRLSEKGKDEMSTRIWSGVRRSEYEFGELPQAVRDKEEEQAYKRLRDATIGSRDEARIPERDRDDFFRAYESGDHKEASRVLDRKSFKENMFRGSESKAVKHADVDTGRGDDGVGIAKAIASAKNPDRPAFETTPADDFDFDVSKVKPKDVTLAEASARVSSADIPNAKAKSDTSIRRG